jgi:hypothetical protein
MSADERAWLARKSQEFHGSAHCFESRSEKSCILLPDRLVMVPLHHEFAKECTMQREIGCGKGGNGRIWRCKRCEGVFRLRLSSTLSSLISGHCESTLFESLFRANVCRQDKNFSVGFYSVCTKNLSLCPEQRLQKRGAGTMQL